MKTIRFLATLVVGLLVGCSTTRTSPKAWNAVKEGMSRKEVAGRIGQPTSRLATGDIWLTDGWELHVAYNQDNRATNVVRILELR